MTARDLRKAAVKLFGTRGWVNSLADGLGVDRGTIYRYINEQVSIPGPVEVAVRCWLKAFEETGEVPMPLSRK